MSHPSTRSIKDHLSEVLPFTAVLVGSMGGGIRTWTHSIRPKSESKNGGMMIYIHERRRFRPFINRSVVSTGAEYFGVIVCMENDRKKKSRSGIPGVISVVFECGAIWANELARIRPSY